MYPYLFESWIGDSVLIPTYGLALALAFTLGYLEAIRQTLLHQEDPKPLEGLFACVLLGMVVGSRLFHVVFEDWFYYFKHPADIFSLWQGGFTLYGGIAGGTVAAVLYCRRKGLPTLRILDRFAPALLLGIAVGRLGCFAAGCCWGKPTSLPWAVSYLHRHSLTPVRDVPVHPVQLYEVFLTGLLFWVVQRYARQSPRQGNVFAVALVGYAVVRFFTEFFRGDKLRGTFPATSLSTSQGLSILLVLAVLTALMRKGQLRDLFSGLRHALRPRTNG
ncbi:prolipoprotein diacylglyceryl transferase [bacterium]|nr:prolipoprotein diacylglyceryl transferase [bacterium]